MYVQLAGEKQCSKCNQCKPLSEFNRCANMSQGRYAQCKVCRSAKYQAKRATGWKAKKIYKPSTGEKPTSWLLPRDPRSFGQQLLAATQRNWNYPVEPAQLKPTLTEWGHITRTGQLVPIIGGGL